MKFTVLGSAGFIGRRMLAYLRQSGFLVETPPRDAMHLRGENLGHVIYAIGLTGDFRSRSEATIDAHVSKLQALMKDAAFESWLYLSSTRVYGGLRDVPATEDALLQIRPGRDALYDLSKLLGESICLGIDRPTIRVARLSNVYGAGQSRHSFLGSIFQDLMRQDKVVIRESCQSSKDYACVDEVVATLASIAMHGRERLYNVASGSPVTHHSLAEVLRQCGYSVAFAADAPTRVFPRIDTSRVEREFGPLRRSVLSDLPRLLEEEMAQCLSAAPNA